MARYPVLDTPCPIKNSLHRVMRGDFCTNCNRQVHDLTAMNENERDAFFDSCSGEICIQIKRPSAAKAIAASLAAASLAMPMAAAAQDAPTAVQEVPTASEANAAQQIAEENIDEVEFVGGIKDPKNVTYKEEKSDKEMSVLPVEYEDEEPAAG